MENKIKLNHVCTSFASYKLRFGRPTRAWTKGDWKQ